MSNDGRCVGAKANVLHCVGFERGDAALLILLKRWHFVFHFSVRFLSVVLSFRVAHNGGGMKRLGLRSSLLSNEEDVDARTKVSQTTKPQLFYDRVLWCVFIFLSLLNMLCK